MINERLEYLSEEVRKGHPVGIREAFEIIEYQKRLREIRDSKKLSFRIKNTMLK